MFFSVLSGVSCSSSQFYLSKKLTLVQSVQALNGMLLLGLSKLGNSQFYLSNKSSGISAAILNKPNVAFYVGFLKFLAVNNGLLQQINRMFTWSNRYLRSQKSLWQVKLPYFSGKLILSINRKILQEHCRFLVFLYYILIFDWSKKESESSDKVLLISKWHWEWE